jgi:TrmH family RNA methyltransferase
MALSKNVVKYVSALQIKKFRSNFNKFLVEGEKIVGELIKQDVFAIEKIYALPEWLENHQSSIPHNVPFEAISETELHKISALKTPNKVLAVVEMPAPANIPTVLIDCALYLDGIQDPGNFGAILRIADWFGIRQVFCSSETADLFNPKVIQATMGAFLRISVQVITLAELLQNQPQIQVYGALLNGQDVFHTQFQQPSLIVIGNEGNGISANNLQFIKHPITIAAGLGGGAESLNAAVATGIIAAVYSNQRAV